MEAETELIELDDEFEEFWRDVKPCDEFLELPEALTHSCLNCGETYLLIEYNGEVTVI